MQINAIKNQNFNGKGILWGDLKALKRGAIALGVPEKKASQILTEISNLFDSAKFDIFIAKPRENVANASCRGAIIVANKNTVCKGIYITPESCKDSHLLDKYLAAAKRLTNLDYSLKNNGLNSLDWIM